MVVCDDEWNWPSFLALPINSVLFEECTRNGLIKCAMMLLWLLPARVSLLTFAGSTRRWCYEMLQVMQYFSNSQVTIWAAETLPHCLKITQNVAFDFWHFSPIFVLLKLTCLVTLFDLQTFKNSPKWTIFGIFNQLLSIQNVNVARFARIVEWDFSVIFNHCGLA